MKGLNGQNVAAAAAVGAGIVAGAMFVKPLVQSFAGGNQMLSGALQVAGGLLLSAVDGRFVKMVGFGIAGAGALDIARGAGLLANA